MVLVDQQAEDTGLAKIVEKRGGTQKDRKRVRNHLEIEERVGVSQSQSESNRKCQKIEIDQIDWYKCQS